MYVFQMDIYVTHVCFNTMADFVFMCYQFRKSFVILTSFCRGGVVHEARFVSLSGSSSIIWISLVHVEAVFRN